MVFGIEAANEAKISYHYLCHYHHIISKIRLKINSLNSELVIGNYIDIFLQLI